MKKRGRMINMLRWFNIEKTRHTTKNYTVWKDTNPDNKEEYEMYSYQTLIIKGTLDSLEITGLYSMTTRRHIRWFVAEHVKARAYIPFELVKMVVANKNYRLDLIHACV
jgi:hypothetical protein